MPKMVEIPDVEIAISGQYKDWLGRPHNITKERITNWVKRNKLQPFETSIEFSNHCKDDLTDLYYTKDGKVGNIFGSVRNVRAEPSKKNPDKLAMIGDVAVLEALAPHIGEQGNFTKPSTVLRGKSIEDEWVSSVAFLGRTTRPGMVDISPLPTYERAAFEEFMGKSKDTDKVIISFENNSDSAGFAAGAEADVEPTAGTKLEVSDMSDELQKAIKQAETTMAAQAQQNTDLLAKFSETEEKYRGQVEKQAKIIEDLQKQNATMDERMKFSQKSENATKGAAFAESLKQGNLTPAFAEKIAVIDTVLRDGEGTIKFSGSEQEFTVLAAFESFCTELVKAGSAGAFVASEGVAEAAAGHPGEGGPAKGEPSKDPLIAKFEELSAVADQQSVRDVTGALRVGKITQEQANNILAGEVE